VQEMIVDLPSSLQGQAVNTQIWKLLRLHHVVAVEYESPVPNVIRWRRKVAKQFNEELGHWEARPQRIDTEKHVMCILSAKEFKDLAIPADDDRESLAKHVAKLTNAYKGCTPMYLIEGLDALIKKSRNARNSAHEAAARNVIGAADGVTPTSGCKKDEIFDEERVADGLLRLQVIHHCMIHETSTSVETAEWVATYFTQHLSTMPYR
jgi:crossover junction endonuclease EME1